jgi:hypothetical protein
MKIESLDQDIRTVLASGYYHVPRFQRPYSWTRENIQEFWDDVVRDYAADYFIGSMVVYKAGNQRFGIVDGQQRLTTIVIFLAAIRNKLASLDFDDLAHGIQGLIERKNIDNKQEFVLSTETSYPFFQDHILKFGEPEVPIELMREEESLRAAYERINSLIEQTVAAIEGDSSLADAKKREAIRLKMIGIRDALLALKVIFVRLDDEDDAYIIFETLNTRGKDLALADLVKNHLTRHLKAKSASVDQTKVKWERILEIIEGSAKPLETDTYIHHFWLSRHEYLPAKGLFKVLKRSVTKADAKQFLADLLSDASIYRSIHETEFAKWSKQESGIRVSLEALQLFRVQQQTPCVLSLVRAYRGKKIKMKHLEEALSAIEKFHLIFTAVTSQHSPGGISAMYASLGRRIFQCADTAAAVRIIKELRTKLRERMPQLQEVVALFPRILFTDEITKQRGLVRYILASFGRAKSGVMPVDYDRMTIEHLVPQSKVGKEGFTEEIVGQLGNLILVPADLNAEELRDRQFAEKKAILQTNNVDLPSDIADAGTWGVEEIQTRTNRMAEKAYTKTWRI